MKTKRSILIIILVIFLLLIFLLTFLKIKNNIDLNSNFDNKIDDINVYNIDFTDITYNFKNNDETLISLDIINNNKETLILNDLLISVYDKNKNLIDVYKFNNPYELEFEKECHMEFILDFRYDSSYFLKIELPEIEEFTEEDNEKKL